MLEEQVLDSPTPRQRRDEVISDLLLGQSVLWLFPRPLETRVVVNKLVAEFESLELGRVVRVRAQNGRRPEDLLYRALSGSEPSGLPTMEDLVAINQGCTVVVVEKWDNLEDQTRVRWYHLLEDNAVLVARSVDTPREAFRFLIPAQVRSTNLARPPQIPQLGIHRYWGWLSLADLELCVREVASQYNLSRVREKWLHTVELHLISTDLILLETFLDQIQGLRDLEDYMPLLRQVAHDRKWTREWLIAQGAEEFVFSDGWPSGGVQPVRPPNENLWGAGVLYWTPEFGAELHAAALALLDRREALAWRLWRGQVATLYPVLDDMRRRLSWLVPSSLHAGETVNTREDTYEFDDLVSWLKELRNSDRIYRDLYYCALQLRQYRNQLAHYRHLSYPEFHNFWRQVDTVVRLCAVQQ